MKNLVNFSKNDIIMFYNFLFIYETEIKGKKYEQFKNRFGQTELEYKRSILRSVVHVLKENLQNMPPTEGFVYIPKSHTKILGVLTHLRNSIAHALIQSKDGCYIIEDYYNGKTAIGMLRKPVVKHLIETLIDEYSRYNQKKQNL